MAELVKGFFLVKFSIKKKKKKKIEKETKRNPFTLIKTEGNLNRCHRLTVVPQKLVSYVSELFKSRFFFSGCLALVNIQAQFTDKINDQQSFRSDPYI